MFTPRQQLIGFYVLLGFVIFLVGVMWWPFWQLLALSGILAVLFQPVHKWFLLKLKKENLSAFLTLLVIIVVIMVPVWLLGQTLFNELVNVYERFRMGNLSFANDQMLSNLPEGIREVFLRFSQDASGIFSSITSNAYNFVSRLLSNFATFFLSIFLVAFMVFYFLRDGGRVKRVIMFISPLPENYETLLALRLERAVSGVVKGSFLVAIIQGAVATFGFFIFGVPQALLWGAFTVVAALVPTIGTALAITPAVIYLFFTGHSGMAVGLTVWGVLAVGLIDNVVSPKLVGSKLEIHPLLALLSIVGGIQVFGFLGFLFGPILMSVLMALYDIYTKDIHKIVETKN